MPLPDPAYQNSAGRLLAILNAIPNGHSYLDEIPKLFDTLSTKEDEKQQACLSGLMELHKLYLEFLHDMTDAAIGDKQRQVLLSGLASLRQTLYPIQLNAGFQIPSEAVRSLLEVAATVLPLETALQQDDLEAIRASIIDLRTLVQDGEIKPGLRKVLLDLIRMSEDAISRFNIYGARGLRKAFKGMLAEAAEIYGLSSGEADHEELKKSGVWPAIVKHLKTFDSVASRILKYRAFFQGAAKLFLGSDTQLTGNEHDPSNP